MKDKIKQIVNGIMKKPDTRMESDSLGEIAVPKNKYYGAQTARSLENFKIGTERMPCTLIRAFAVIKKAAALINCELGVYTS